MMMIGRRVGAVEGVDFLHRGERHNKKKQCWTRC